MLGTSFSTILKRSAICILFLGIISFSIFQSRGLLTGPSISIDSPKNMSRLTKPLVEISGNITNATEVKLNGQKIFLDTSRRFAEQLLLSEGTNTITLVAKDRFGRSKSSIVQLIYTPSRFTAVLKGVTSRDDL